MWANSPAPNLLYIFPRGTNYTLLCSGVCDSVLFFFPLPFSWGCLCSLTNVQTKLQNWEETKTRAVLF